MMLGLSLALPAVQRQGGVAFAAPAAGVTASLASLGIPVSGKGTYLIKATLDAVSTGTAQVFFQIDSGSATTRFLLQAAAASSVYQLSRANSGTVTTNGGAISGATPMRLGMAIDDAGGAIATLDGATAITVSGGPTAGLTTLRLGAGVGGASLVGTIALVRILPGVAMSAADLQAAVLAL